MSNKPITIGIAGKGKITYNHLSELLDDWLDVTKDGDIDRETTWVIPVAKETDGDTQDSVLRYLEDLNLPYIAVTDGTALRAQRPILRSAEEVDEVDEEADLSNGVVNRLVSATQAGHETVLLLAWGEKEASPDDLTEHLLEDAILNEIMVLDLTNGLDDIGFKNDDPEDDGDEEDDPEPPAKTTRRKTTKAAPKEAEDAGSTLAGAIADKVTDVVPLLQRAREVLDRAQEVYGALSALRALAGTEKYDQDTADVQELLTAIDEMERGLTTPLGRFPDAEPEAETKSRSQARRRKIVEDAKEPAEKTPAKAPAQRGKPRADEKPEGKTVKVIETGPGVYKKIGRGRPPAVGTETRGGTVVAISQSVYDEIDWS